MDRHLQRIMDNAADASDQNRSGHYAFGEGRPAEHGLDMVPRLDEDPMLLSELGECFLLLFDRVLARLTVFGSSRSKIAQPRVFSSIFNSTQ
jgi:hypothetical protein